MVRSEGRLHGGARQQLPLTPGPSPQGGEGSGRKHLTRRTTSRGFTPPARTPLAWRLNGGDCVILPPALVEPPLRGITPGMESL